MFYPAGHDTEHAAPAILLSHGGGWNAGTPEWTLASAKRFASRGMVAVSVEYRLSGEETTPVEALADACAAFRWVRRTAADLGVDPDRVAAHGVSAGGRLVAMTGCGGCPTEHPDDIDATPDALLLWSPALDVESDGWFH